MSALGSADGLRNNLVGILKNLKIKGYNLVGILKKLKRNRKVKSLGVKESCWYIEEVEEVMVHWLCGGASTNPFLQ
ncbi:hypothetical protein Leryth_022017 [Lithospermum erythrorhizon]|nr:hypothetical protein Leryth_022017 [Lithospermum erythrorhizon]